MIRGELVVGQAIHNPAQEGTGPNRRLSRCDVRSGMDTGHLLAFVRAMVAGVGTALAVVRLVFAAFLAAFAADLRAQFTNHFRKLRSRRHESCGGGTDARAIAIERNTARHHLYILFFQAGAGAMFALRGAFVAGFDTILESLVHNSCSFIVDG